jgi:hypothetical protein
MRGMVCAAAMAAGLLSTAPQLVAHGNECLFARVSQADGGDITVELTADIEGNPLIGDPGQARGILAGALQVRIGERRYRLEDLAALTWEQRTRLSDDAPVPPPADASPHQLLTAVWHARLPGRTVTFVTPDRTPHDVLLWDAGSTPATGRPRWMLLICGEESHAYALPATSTTSSSPFSWLAALTLAVLVPALCFLGAWRRLLSATLSVAHRQEALPEDAVVRRAP